MRRVRWISLRESPTSDGSPALALGLGRVCVRQARVLRVLRAVDLSVYVMIGPHIVLWSAMRSGSTEFAKDLARICNWRYADEALNPRLSKFQPRVLEEVKGSASRSILKFFPGHYKAPGVHLQCAIALERPPGERWCSLLHARATGRWSVRRKKRAGCADARTRAGAGAGASPPPFQFTQRHNAWFQQLPRHALLLSFENITTTKKSRAAAIDAACKHCNRNHNSSSNHYGNSNTHTHTHTGL